MLPSFPPASIHRWAPLDPNFDGTPTPWSSPTDTSTFKEILVSTDPAGTINPDGTAAAQPGTQSQITVAGLQTEAAMSWVSDASHIFGIRYEVQGDVDPFVLRRSSRAQRRRSPPTLWRIPSW